MPDFSTVVVRVNQVGMGIDFTARDLEAELQAKGLPWERPRRLTVGLCAYDLADLNFHLDRNGWAVQRGETAQMSGKVNALITYIPTFFTLNMCRRVISRAKNFFNPK